MKNIRVSENVKMYFEHEYFGRIEIPINRIENEERSVGVYPSIHFVKRGDAYCPSKPVSLGISLICIHIEEHIEENNLGAETRAIEQGCKKLDRYIVKDMCIEEILFNENGVRVYCTWEDCYGYRRMYYSATYRTESNEDMDTRFGTKQLRLYAVHDKPTFYF